MHRFGHTLHLLKCTFFVKEVSFLGYVISKEGFKPDPKLVQGIEDLAVPRSVKDLQICLGMFQYQSKFLKDFAFDIEALRVDLTDALHKDAKGPIVISEKGRNAFFAMKKKIVDVVSSKSLLSFPTWNRKHFIETDASRTAVGVGLSV